MKYNLSELIKSKRIELKISQERLAEKIKLPRGSQFISNVERSLCQLPIKHLDAVCKELGINKEEAIELLVLDLRLKINEVLNGQKTNNHKSLESVRQQSGESFRPIDGNSNPIF